MTIHFRAVIAFLFTQAFMGLNVVPSSTGIYWKDSKNAMKLVDDPASHSLKVWNRNSAPTYSNNNTLESFSATLYGAKTPSTFYIVSEQNLIKEIPGKVGARPIMWILGNKSKKHATKASMEYNTSTISPTHGKPPQIFILLTMSVNVRIHVNYTAQGQQRDPKSRMLVYERSVLFYAANTTLPVVVVENSGATDFLDAVRRKIPETRRATMEFVSVPLRNERDIGSAEASSVLDALNTSVLLRDKGPRDLVVKVTGRYCVHNISEVLQATCFDPMRSMFPHLVVSRPRYNTWRQETAVIGFNSFTQDPLLLWAELGGSNFEKHAGDLVNSMSKDLIATLLPMSIIPVQEGSTSIWRDHV